VNQSRPGASTTPITDETDSLIDWISQQTGLSFRSQRDSAAEIINRYVQSSNSHTAAACRQKLESNQAAFDDLVGELTVGETYFYRDEKQFDLIAGEFLDVMQASRPADHRLRVWSAGCASGEEAWTLAAVFTNARRGNRTDVLGTDISQNSLTRARAGEYGSWSLRGSAGEKMRRWGSESDRRFTVADRLRPMVTFEYLNLAADQYPSFTSKTVGLDLILCRNVMIYFDRATIQSVAAKLFRCLSPGGWLITGASDPPLADYAPFKVLMRDCGQVYVRPDLSEAAPSQVEARSSAGSHQTLPKTAPPQGMVPGQSKLDRQERPQPPSQEARNRDQQLRHVTQKRVAVPVEPPHELAARCLSQGNYQQVLDATNERSDDVRCCILRVRALANLDTEQAEEFCSQAAAQHQVSAELHYLHAILLTELARHSEAATAARSSVFLDQNLIVGHLALGSALERLGQTAGARRSFRNACRLSENWPANRPVPCSDGESASRLAESATRHLALLDANH
jgi:chemotaxis protein methyltransferase CheR